MDPSQFDFFKLNLEQKEDVNSLFLNNEVAKNVVATIEMNYRQYSDSQARQNKLSEKVDRRSISIFETGLLDLRLKTYIKQCGQEDKDENNSILDNITSNYWTYLSIRGDGNCFYRSFMLAYIIKISMIESTKPLCQLIQLICDLKDIKYQIDQKVDELLDKEKFKSHFTLSDSSDTLEQVKQNDQCSPKKQDHSSSTQKFQIDTSTTESIMKEDNQIRTFSEEMQVVVLSFLWQLLIQKQRKNYFEVSHLLEYYNNNPELDISLIIICKNLLLTELEHMKQDNNQKEFIDETAINEVMNLLIIYGESAQGLVLKLAARAFKCRLEVQSIYFNEKNSLISNLLTYEEGQENEQQVDDNSQKLQISVWYTGGHYDILFDKLFSEQNMQFCFSETITYQSNNQKNDYQNYELSQQRQQSLSMNLCSPPLGQDSDNIFKEPSDEIFKSLLNDGMIEVGDTMINYKVGTTNSNEDRQLDIFYHDRDNEDEKLQELNKMVQKRQCFMCEEQNKQYVVIDFDSISQSICWECFSFQYNQIRLSKMKDSLLNLDQIQSCLQQIIAQHTLNSKCITCNEKIEFQQEYQKLTLINMATGLPLEQKNKKLKTQHNQSEINLEKVQIGEEEIDVSVNPNLKIHADKKESSLNNEPITYCLFCDYCLREYFLYQNQILQNTNYSIYLKIFDGEVDFAFNESLYRYCMNIITEEYLKQAIKQENGSNCRICTNEMFEINTLHVDTNHNTTIKLCYYCLYYKDFQSRNPLYSNKQAIQFFQIQNYLNYLQYMNEEQQCIVCKKSNQDDNKNSLQQMDLQKFEAREELFSFNFLERDLHICSSCVFGITINISHQNIQVKPSNFENELTIYIGQKKMIDLLKFISSICQQCKQQKFQPFDLQQLLKITKVENIFHYCDECQPLPLASENNLNKYEISENNLQDFHMGSSNQISSFDVEDSKQINTKRKHFSEYESNREGQCQRCKVYSHIYDNTCNSCHYTKLCEKCKFFNTDNKYCCQSDI